MSDEHALTLRPIDQTRGDLYAIQDEIECMKAQLAQLPTRAYFSQTLLMATASIWMLLGALALLLARWWAPDRRGRLRPSLSRPYIPRMPLDLFDEETAALIRELHDIIESDRFPFSPRIRTLRGILAKLRPEPVREPLPPPKVYAPPRAKAGRRRG